MRRFLVDFCWICWFWNEKVIGGGYWGGWAFGKYRQAPHYRTGGEELVYFGWLCQDYGECLQLYHHHCAFTGSVIWGERYKKISGFLGQKWGKRPFLAQTFAKVWVGKNREIWGGSCTLFPWFGRRDHALDRRRKQKGGSGKNILRSLFRLVLRKAASSNRASKYPKRAIPCWWMTVR